MQGGGGEVQGGKEAGDLGLEEPDPMAQDGRPLLLSLEGGLCGSQLLFDDFDGPLKQLML